MWRIEFRTLTQGNLTVDQYANRLKSLISRVDPNGLMTNEEKVAYLTAGANAIFQPFLFVANPATLDLRINIMRSMESGAKINVAGVQNNLLKTRINDLETQLMTLNINLSSDRQANLYRNETRFNRDQRNYQGH